MNYEEYKVRVYANGDKEWYQNDKRHRTDGPAVEYANGAKFWYQNDKLHRTDGPAVEWADGDKEWWQDEWADGDKEWWLEGEELSEEEFLARMKDSCAGKIVEIDGKKYQLREF